MKPNSFALLALAAASLLALTGCASTDETSGKGKHALVCPQCKMVAMTVNRPPSGGAGRYAGTQTVYHDICPYCQGAMETLFKEGKFKHKCSICKDSPYACPICHPISG